MDLLATLLAMDMSVLSAFIVAGILLNLTPGADVMYVTAAALNGGTRTGLAASIGISLGVLTHVALASIGVAALLAANPAMFQVIRWMGIAYLAWLAIMAWRNSSAPNMQTVTASRTIAKGWLTNILNPKVALFILAFLPQFTSPEAGPVWQQIIVLGLIFVSTGTLITCAYALCAGTIAGRLRRHHVAMNRIAATMLAALAARLALQ